MSSRSIRPYESEDDRFPLPQHTPKATVPPWLRPFIVAAVALVLILCAVVLVGYFYRHLQESAKLRAPGPGRPARIGDMEIRIDRVQLGGRLECIGAGQYHDNDGLAIYLTATNVGDTHIIRYRRWESHLFESHAPYLTDEFDNHYGHTRSFDASTLRGQSSRSTFRPGDSDTDVLLFDAPIPKAKKVILYIPNPDGDDGYTEFVIPRSAWEKR